MRKRVEHGVKAGWRRNTLAIGVALCSLVWTGMAAALGMGEIRLHSALNQPLNAEIQLIETAGLDPDDIVVKLASPEAFSKAGIERVFFLNDLRFTPVIRGNSGYIQVSSNKAVVEPYLSFLVQVSRPNGDLLHEYTLLLDPATTPEGLAATRNRKPLQDSAAMQDSRMPKAPPMAVQGQHYTVVEGDTLNSIARRLQGSGSRGSAAQLSDGIQALNPLAFPAGAGSALRAGQNLLLPDAALVPKSMVAEPPANQVAEVPAPVDAQKAAQLAADAIQNQQLEDLKSLNRSLQEQVFERDKAVTVLQARLAEMHDAPKAAVVPGGAIGSDPAAPAPQSVMPAAAPVPVPAQVEADNPLFNLQVLLGVVVALLLLILGLRLRQRRQGAPTPEHIEPAVSDERLIKPAQATALPVYEIPAVAPQAAAPVQSVNSGASLSKAPASQRLAGAAPDALDGVSIYIAYGRFNEALGILRDALSKQPEREDIRERILELLAEQGDIPGFEREEQTALEHGMDREKIQAIRARYPQLKPSSAAVPSAIAVGAAAAAVAATAVAASVASEPAPAKPEAPAQLDETAAAALNPEHADEFQLNLDDLSMDADWDLVDPFDKPAPHGKAEAPEAAPLDPHFASNLTELPEVFELHDEPFLGDPLEPGEPFELDESLDLGYPADESIEIVAPVDADTELSGFDLLDGLGEFSEPEADAQDRQPIETIDLVEPSDNDALDDAFLDSFADDDGMEFDLMELDEEPLTQINQAQLMIDEGDVNGARRLLEQVLESGDEAHQQMARDLLSSLE